MADRYLTDAEVAMFVGTSVVEALSADSTEDGEDVLDTLIKMATASVQPAMRNSGYEVPADPTGTVMTDQTVKLAVMGALWPLLHGRSEFGVQLPENWAEHPANVARKQILNGDAPLTLAVTARDAIGGVSFTDSDPDSAEGRPARMSREEIGTGF